MTKKLYLSGLGALASMVCHTAAYAQEPMGPAGGQLALAPVIVANEPAPVEQAAGESGRLFHGAPLPDAAGELRLLRFSAPGAAAYRLYFAGTALPKGARMFIYGLDGAGRVTETFGPYEGSGPLLEGTFRSRIVPGVEAVVEVQGLTAGSDWPFRMPWVASINAGLLSELRAAHDPSLAETADQRKPARGERTQIELDGELVTAEIRDGEIIVGGDIAVASVTPAGKGPQPRFAVLRTEAAGRWPGGVVPFQGNLSGDPRVTAAMQMWTSLTMGVITFVPRTSEPDYLNFMANPASACSSGVGRMGGATNLKLGPTCTMGNAIHEVGHALGLSHEQQRIDRDSHIRILWDNIDTLDLGDHNFERRSAGAHTDIGGYDFGSVMHYPFSIGSVPIMEPLHAVPAGVTVGQRNAPSAGDLTAMRVHYGASLSRKVLAVPGTGGTFSVAVSAPSDRFWVAKDTADWISIGSGLSGQGNGTIQFTVGPNIGSSRTAKINLALTPALQINDTLEVSQAGASCTYSVSPSSISAAADPGTYTVTVSTQPGCPWGTSETLSWVALSPSTGTGPGSVAVRLTGNFQQTPGKPTPSARRTGSVTIAGKTVSLSQEGGCLTCN